MKRFATIFIVLILVTGVGGVFAQAPDVCSPDEGLPALEAMIAAIDTSTPESYLQGVVNLRLMLTVIDESCTDLQYSSEADGMEPVIGPVIIPEGIYRAVFTTDGFGIVDVEAVDGVCSAEEFTTNVFNVSEGLATGGVEALFNSEGCLALITFSNVSAPWALNFEPIVLGG